MQIRIKDFGRLTVLTTVSGPPPTAEVGGPVKHNRDR
jgi:hypothetical protein